MIIDIGTVLQHFDDTYDEQDQTVKQYGLKFITADGRLRTMRSRKNVKSPKQQLQTAHQKRAKGLFNLKRNGTMLVHDLDKDLPRTVKVFSFCAFKDFNSPTWFNIRH